MDIFIESIRMLSLSTADKISYFRPIAETYVKCHAIEVSKPYKKNFSTQNGKIDKLKDEDLHTTTDMEAFFGSRCRIHLYV